jgi:hypothetical protein
VDPADKISAAHFYLFKEATTPDSFDGHYEGKFEPDDGHPLMGQPKPELNVLIRHYERLVFENPDFWRVEIDLQATPAPQPKRRRHV